MKNINIYCRILIVLFVAAIVFLSGCDVIEYILDEDAPAPPTSPPKSPHSGEFTNKPWVDFDVKGNDGQSGMLIHTSFEVNGLKNLECVLAVQFEFASGERLKDFNNKYVLSGKPGTFLRFVPEYEHASYDNARLFFPYEELHLASGSHKLRLFLTLADNSPKYEDPVGTLDTSEYYYFTVTIP